MSERTSKKSDVPLNRFDMMAGAKALYEDFAYRIARTDRFKPWTELTQKQHEQWAQLLKTGIRKALATKAAKTSGGGSAQSWWKLLVKYT